MLKRLRTVFIRPPATGAPTYTQAELEAIGAAYRNSRLHLAQVRALPPDAIEKAYAKMYDR